MFSFVFRFQRLAQISTQPCLRLLILPLGNGCLCLGQLVDSLLGYFAGPAIFARGSMFGDMAAAIVIVPLGWNVFLLKFWPGVFPPFLTPGVFAIFFIGV